MKEFGELLQRFDPNLDYLSARENAIRFGVGNGSNQLRSYFNEVVYKGFHGGLNITDEKAIVDYLISSNNDLKKTLCDEKLLEFVYFLASEKEANNGFIYITKETGLFASI
ncbi:hypothetical protein QO000_002071 [Alkalihalobacillus hemicentroti]|uniref:Uncharacterized protein n=1 Tax=Guptibacillus hwajinpoensis TaxID=208199 RepID=A0ABU0K486_9BACL|nr:hypothetical protein [Alkalihalobacillus hemicentroti]